VHLLHPGTRALIFENFCHILKRNLDIVTLCSACTRALIFENFCQALELFPDNYFDLVYLDGYAHTGNVRRFNCAKIIVCENYVDMVYLDGYAHTRNVRNCPPKTFNLIPTP
jgi:hypothetical protein